jgi:hypothetical protein
LQFKKGGKLITKQDTWNCTKNHAMIWLAFEIGKMIWIIIILVLVLQRRILPEDVRPLHLNWSTNEPIDFLIVFKIER